MLGSYEMSDDESRVSFICTSQDHRDRPPRAFAFTLHEGAWAYCAGGDDGEHQWERADPPRSLADIRQLVSL